MTPQALFAPALSSLREDTKHDSAFVELPGDAYNGAVADMRNDANDLALSRSNSLIDDLEQIHKNKAELKAWIRQAKTTETTKDNGKTSDEREKSTFFAPLSLSH